MSIVSLGLPSLRAVATSATSANPAEGTSLSLPPNPQSSGLIDRFGRKATDLRISLTDKCNLRCSYCMPAEGLAWLPKNQLLTAAQIHRLVRIGVSDLCVREVRFTGGEPLVRADLTDILALIRQEFPQLPLSLTTNAIGLRQRAQALKDAGLSRINVSLDSIHPETFAQLTRRPFLDKVLDGIAAAQEAGLEPLKINAVLMRGINDKHAVELLDWCLHRGLELRFIEQMPLDADHGWRREGMVTAADIREQLSSEFELGPDPQERDGAPAERFLVYRGGEFRGTVGIIASVTEPFCADCRRTRITAEGKVMSCLFSREEVDLKALLDADAADVEITRMWQSAMWAKPKAHGMDHVGLDSEDYVQPERTMSAIGG